MKSGFALNSNALCIEMNSKWELYLTTFFPLGIIDSLHPLVVYSFWVFSSPTPHDGEGNDHILPSGYVWMTLTLTSPTPALHSPSSGSDPATTAKAALFSELPLPPRILCAWSSYIWLLKHSWLSQNGISV